jgi:predicted metal-dependent phosphoesterase TrpH
VIDLHLHTTASDGRSTPRELVALASDAGLTVMAATDHDTTAAVAEVAALAREQRIHPVSGIEITAVHEGLDVHVLGYFIASDSPPLQRFLAAQRQTRVARVEAIGARLAELGMPVDLTQSLDEARLGGGRAIGRPQVARAMVAAGHVPTVQEAFDRWLAHGRPAFVPRSGASPEAVIAIIHGARGLASLAHPGRTRIDERIQALRDAGLDALEAFHSDHSPPEAARYADLADTLGLLCTGGSDFHGEPSRLVSPGSSNLPPDRWQQLMAARGRHA